MKRGFVVLLAVGALLIVAGAAGASVIVYQCGGNLCRINPDGTGHTQLTSNGLLHTSHMYQGPSLSRSGAKLSFVYFEQVYVSDANAQHRSAAFPNTHTAVVTRMRPDGGRLLELEDTISPLGVDVCTYNANGSGRNCPYGAGGANWASDGNLLIASPRSAGNQVICKVPVAAFRPCSDVVAQDSSSDLYDPAVSPNGKTLAVTVTGQIGTRVTGHIALYNYATGAFEHDLTNGNSDAQPVWSPDGSQIAFDRGSSIYVISARGVPGDEYRLTTGNSPTWGGLGTTKLSLSLPAHQSPAKAGRIASTVGCSATCYLGAYAEVRIGRESPFEVDSNVFHLKRAGRKSVPVVFSHRQVRQIRAALKAHKRVVAMVRGQLTNASGRADLHETGARTIVIRG